MSAAPAEVFLPPTAFVGWRLRAALEPARCAALLGQLDARGFARTGEAYPDGYRNNDRLVLDDPAIAAALFTTLRARLPAELAFEGARWRLSGLNPRLRACRYRGGQAFSIHRDGPFVPTPDHRSLLTVQLYLDDDPARVGGRTRFYADAAGATVWAQLPPACGDVIVFDHRAWHDGEAVTAGVKHVLRTDALYTRIGASAAPPAPPPETDIAVRGRHRGYAWRVIHRRDGTLASAGRDGTVRGWGAAGALWAHDLGAGSVTALAEAADGALWCGTRAGALVRIAPGRGAGAPTVIADDLGAVLAATALGDRVVVATSRGRLHAWTATGAPAWAVGAHTGWAWAVAADGARVISCGDDGRVIATAPDGRAHTLAAFARPLRAVAAGAAGVLVGAADGAVDLLAPDGERTGGWRAHAAALTAVAAAPDGSWLTAGEDGWVRRWRAGRAVAAAASPDIVSSVAVAGAGRVAWTAYDGVIRTGTLAGERARYAGTSAAFGSLASFV